MYTYKHTVHKYNKERGEEERQEGTNTGRTRYRLIMHFKCAYKGSITKASIGYNNACMHSRIYAYFSKYCHVHHHIVLGKMVCVSVNMLEQSIFLR